MQPTKLRYTLTEKEAAAVVFALRKIIYASGGPLTLKTDQKALPFLRSCRLLTVS